MARSRQHGRQAKTPKAEKKAAKAARAAEAKKLEDVLGKPANGSAGDSSSNKRKRDTDSQDQEGPTKKQKKQQQKAEERLKRVLASADDPSISPVTTLNLYHNNLKYEELGGTPFKMAVKVDGVRYEGEGETSKEAKRNAAQAAVKAVVEKLKAGEGWEVKFN